jgi:hypothetical protein
MIRTREPIRGRQPVHFEHWWEEPGCKKWGGSGYDVGKGETRWFCYEHRRLEFPLPKTVLS